MNPEAGRFVGNFQKGRELVWRFREAFGGVTGEDLQQRFTGRTYDMWRPEECQAFSDARGQQCALATATVTLVLSLGLIRWLAPALLGVPSDLQLVQVSREVPPFFAGVFRAED